MAAPPKFAPVPWSLQTNIYEVNIRQYTAEGTFQAFMKHIPRLKDMGVETLWLMPITPIATIKRLGMLGSYYACSSYVQVNPEFGKVEDLQALVKHAHQLDMKVIIDWVANHTGYGHEWTETNKDFYTLDEAGNFTERNGWEDVIDLDYTNTALRVAMVQAMAYWVKTCDIDGFRCDVAHLVPLDFWEKARTFLDNIKPLYWLAETDESTYHTVFDCSYAWRWMHVMEEMIPQKRSVIMLDKVLYQYLDELVQGAQKLYFTTNHDENSWNGTEYEKYNGAALPLAVFTATWNGIPLIYSGQELPNLKRLAFFEKDAIDWKPNCELADFYKTLLKLRKSNPALTTGSRQCFTWRISTGYEQVFVFLRSNGNNRVLVVLNFSGEHLHLQINDHRVSGLLTEVFTGVTYNFDKERSIELPSYGYLVMER